MSFYINVEINYNAYANINMYNKKISIGNNYIIISKYRYGQNTYSIIFKCKGKLIFDIKFTKNELFFNEFYLSNISTPYFYIYFYYLDSNHIKKEYTINKCKYIRNYFSKYSMCRYLYNVYSTYKYLFSLYAKNKSYSISYPFHKLNILNINYIKYFNCMRYYKNIIYIIGQRMYKRRTIPRLHN